MSIQSTLKPNGSSSARSIRPTASTPGRFSVPLFWLTHFSSMATVRACSASTVRTIACSGGLSLAKAGAAKPRAKAATKA